MFKRGEKFNCGSRASQRGDTRKVDSWRKEKNGDRTCSYCGSLHPDDWTDIMWRYSQGEEGYDFERSDKGYKDYGHRAGVRNASDGGIKFYGWHVPDDPDKLDELYAARKLATAVSNHKFEERMERFKRTGKFTEE